MAAKLVSNPSAARQKSSIHAGRGARSRCSADAREQRVLDFLGDVLAGDARWQIGEVQRLLALHTLVAIGRHHAEGLDQP